MRQRSGCCDKSGLENPTGDSQINLGNGSSGAGRRAKPGRAGASCEQPDDSLQSSSETSAPKYTFAATSRPSALTPAGVLYSKTCLKQSAVVKIKEKRNYRRGELAFFFSMFPTASCPRRGLGIAVGSKTHPPNIPTAVPNRGNPKQPAARACTWGFSSLTRT